MFLHKRFKGIVYRFLENGDIFVMKTSDFFIDQSEMGSLFTRTILFF